MFRFMLASLIFILLPAVMPPPAAAVPEGLTLTWPGGREGTVVFNGTAHAKAGLQCDPCHISGLFQTKYGSDKMTMADLDRGQFCGACHNGKKAFSTSDPKSCRRCHPRKKGQ